MIDKAAISYLGVIYSLPRPNRHHDIIRYMVESCGVVPPCSGVQGFLTTTNEFVDRKQARIIAENQSQLLPRASKSVNLFSEDVW